MLTLDSDASGAEKKDVSLGSSEDIQQHVTNMLQESDTATAILKKKKKPNSLMYVESH